MSVKNRAFVFHDRLGAYMLLTICLSTCVSASRCTVTKNQENVSFPEATTPQGTVRGVEMLTFRNRTVNGFIGIPYAQPPVDGLRFKAPLPPSAWNGTFDARNHATACVQMNSNNEVAGDEDCLYLNVFTPQLPTKESSTLLPVIFYVFGGEFQNGNATILELNPDFLLDKDVILVIPNFRLGVLAWLSTGDEVSPGNYGLKDIVRALEWNRDNIKYFGGDPERVTLVGSSSGSMSVSLLLMSDTTKGLFHRFIEQSGSALNLNLQTPNKVAVKRAFALGAYLGCPTNTSALLVNCLRGLNASQLVDTTLLFKVSDLVPYIPWLPTAEPDIDGAFLTETPVEILASGKIRDLPSIRSNVRDEGLVATAAFYTNPVKFQNLVDDIDYLLPYLVGYADAIKNVTAYTAALKSYYLNDLTSNRNSSLLTNVTQLVSDATFIYPLYKELIRYVALAKSPQYYSVFEHRGVFSYSYDYSGGSTKDIGVSHADELIYLFYNHDNRFGPSWYRFSEADLNMVETMVELWTSFVINGTPNATDKNGKNIWEPYSSNRSYLRIGKSKKVGLDVEYGWLQQQMDFLAELDAKTQ